MPEDFLETLFKTPDSLLIKSMDRHAVHVSQWRRWRVVISCPVSGQAIEITHKGDAEGLSSDFFRAMTVAISHSLKPSKRC